jgi:hypothetical protein
VSHIFKGPNDTTVDSLYTPFLLVQLAGAKRVTRNWCARGSEPLEDLTYAFASIAAQAMSFFRVSYCAGGSYECNCFNNQVGMSLAYASSNLGGSYFGAKGMEKPKGLF